MKHDDCKGDLLIVDDSRESLQLLINILGGEGYRVRPAISGTLALLALSEHLPDLILLDVRMSDLDGIEVCRKIKAQERTKDIPVIFISALDSANDKIRGLNAGGVDYITKPIQKDEVLARVRTHLELHRVKKQADTLLQENRQLTQRMFSVQEHERRTLSHELHDQFAQWLAALMVEAQFILNKTEGESPKIYASAKAIYDNATTMQKGMRDLSTSLRPPVLDALGLELSLTELVDNWNAQYPGIDCELFMDGKLDELGEKLNISLFRIIQESLTNVAKHSNASEVVVRLIHSITPDETGTLSLHIEDNGTGIRPDSEGAGMGLLGIRERVVAAGGKFTLYSEESGGVCIDVTIPVCAGTDTDK